jgi:V-type H+-transporting ATPase subunit E
MDTAEAATILSSMVQFIRTHGNERVHTINKQASDEFTVQKEQYIAEEKERITSEIRERLRKDEINLKIERSKQENVLRIEKMRTINELILKLFKDTRFRIFQLQKQEARMYADLIKNLIVQGLIKLMEPEVHIRCRRSDLKVVQGAIVSAIDEYQQLMKAEVKSLRGKTIPINIIVDEVKFLPEFNERSDNPTDSCLGGIVMHARKGRIVCSNTLDERLTLIQQEAIPQIRNQLFPCLIREPKPDTLS